MTVALNFTMLVQCWLLVSPDHKAAACRKRTGKDQWKKKHQHFSKLNFFFFPDQVLATSHSESSNDALWWGVAL